LHMVHFKYTVEIRLCFAKNVTEVYKQQKVLYCLHVEFCLVSITDHAVVSGNII